MPRFHPRWFLSVPKLPSWDTSQIPVSSDSHSPCSVLAVAVTYEVRKKYPLLSGKAFLPKSLLELCLRTHRGGEHPKHHRPPCLPWAPRASTLSKSQNTYKILTFAEKSSSQGWLSPSPRAVCAPQQCAVPLDHSLAFIDNAVLTPRQSRVCFAGHHPREVSQAPSPESWQYELPQHFQPAGKTDAPCGRGVPDTSSNTWPQLECIIGEHGLAVRELSHAGCEHEFLVSVAM